MHGSSSVPKELQDIVNEYGGKLKETWGVPVEEIQLGIRNGVRKINVDTDNRLAITGAIRKVLWTQPEKFDPRDYMKPAREAMQKVVSQRMTQFGQAGHADDYSPIAIAEIAKGYKDGSLATRPWSPPSNPGLHIPAGGPPFPSQNTEGAPSFHSFIVEGWDTSTLNQRSPLITVLCPPSILPQFHRGRVGYHPSQSTGSSVHCPLTRERDAPTLHPPNLPSPTVCRK